MSEITNNRITGLKTSIHSLRLRIGFFWSYLNKQNKEKFETNHLDKKNIKKELPTSKSNLDKKTNISNKKLKNNKLDEKRSISKNDNGLITLLPGECVINQGEKGNSAFLIISGSFNVEINNKVVGGMSSGEIFGELSLILGENRKATVRAVTGSELVEIDSSFLKEYFLSTQSSSDKVNSSGFNTQTIIKDLSVELGKQKDQSINITKEQLIEAVKDESHVIQSLAIQLHKRLSQMIMKEKKSQL
jgi:CRP-like cAMP-binding protein